MAVEPEAKKSRVELRYGVFTFCLQKSCYYFCCEENWLISKLIC